MKNLFICSVILLLFSACGVTKLTPAKGIYLRRATESINHPSKDQYKLKSSEEILISEGTEVNAQFPDESEKQEQSLIDGLQVTVSGISIILNEFKQAEISKSANEGCAVHKVISTGRISKGTHSKIIIKHPQKKSFKRDVDWEMLGLIGFYILLVIVLALAFFGTGTWAAAATIIVAIGYAILLIAAVVCILWFLNFVFFGWLKY